MPTTTVDGHNSHNTTGSATGSATGSTYKRWIDPVDNVELTNPAGAALILGVSLRTAYRYVTHGDVEVRMQPSGRTLIAIRSLYALRARGVESGAVSGAGR